MAEQGFTAERITIPEGQLALEERITLHHGIIEMLEKKRAGIGASGVGAHPVGIAGKGGPPFIKHVPAVVWRSKATTEKQHRITLQGHGGHRHSDDRGSWPAAASRGQRASDT